MGSPEGEKHLTWAKVIVKLDYRGTALAKKKFAVVNQKVLG